MRERLCEPLGMRSPIPSLTPPHSSWHCAGWTSPLRPVYLAGRNVERAPHPARFGSTTPKPRPPAPGMRKKATVPSGGGLAVRLILGQWFEAKGPWSCVTARWSSFAWARRRSARRVFARWIGELADCFPMSDPTRASSDPSKALRAVTPNTGALDERHEFRRPSSRFVAGAAGAGNSGGSGRIGPGA